MPLNSGILQQIAAGGQSLVPQMMAKGAQLGQQLKQAQQADQDRSALQQIAQSFGQDGSEAAIGTAGELGQLGPALQIQQRQTAQEAAARKAGQARSSVGKMAEDFRRGLIDRGQLESGIQALRNPNAGFVSVAPGGTLIDKGTGQPVFKAPGKPAKPVRLKPSELKFKRESENNVLNLEATIKRLTEAEALVDKAFSGAGAGIRGAIGTNLPDFLVHDSFADPEGSVATTELGNLLSMDAITAMAQSLTGATTNFELQKFVDILADPASPPELKRRTIKRMMDLSADKLALEKERVQDFEDQVQGQQRPQQGQQGQLEQTPIEANTQAALQEAQEAIEAGADPQAVIQRMQDAGFDTTGLQ